jgi:hypothetical protein
MDICCTREREREREREKEKDARRRVLKEGTAKGAGPTSMLHGRHLSQSRLSDPSRCSGAPPRATPHATPPSPNLSPRHPVAARQAWPPGHPVPPNPTPRAAPAVCRPARRTRAHALPCKQACPRRPARIHFFLITIFSFLQLVNNNTSFIYRTPPYTHPLPQDRELGRLRSEALALAASTVSLEQRGAASVGQQVG